MNDKPVPVALFRLGRIVTTANALEQISLDDITRAIQRHQAGDWGDLGEHDREANDSGLVDGDRLLSAYNSSSGVRFWIITEWDRSVTTVLLPEDY
jgi:hypothetical protein